MLMKITLKNSHKVMHGNLACSTRQTETLSMLPQTKGEEEDGEDTSEEDGESSEHVSHSIVLQCVDTLLDYMGQSGFEYSDITAARKIYTAVKRSLNSSQKQAITTNCFSK
jgi:hypothetical protein